MTTYTVQRDGERLDLICWRWYGQLSGREVERVLEANPGLAARGPHALPAGVTVQMPVVSAAPAPAPRTF